MLAGLAAVAGLITISLGHQSTNAHISLAIDRVVTDRLAAESGIRRLAVAIDDPRDPLEDEVGIGGEGYLSEVVDRSVRLAIEGEAGKIDPVTADMAILVGYIGDALLPEGDETSLLTQLQASRIAGNGPRAMEALYAYLTSTVPSEEVDRDFTLRSGLAGVDPRFASERVLRAVPDIDDETVSRMVRERMSSLPETWRGMSRHFAVGGRKFSLVASVLDETGVRYAKRVPIEITTAGRVLFVSGFR